MHRILKNQRGFTLIELVIIIILIGLLAGVAIPRFVNLRSQAIIASAKANLDGGRAGISLNFADETLNTPPYTPPAFGGTGVLASTTEVENLLEGTPNYPPDGPYNSPAGQGFRWYVLSLGNANSPPRVTAVIDVTCPSSASLATPPAANDDCDVDKL
jgi:prepilin-type N-terminal cleavage/methylation domain-containing protein